MAVSLGSGAAMPTDLDWVISNIAAKIWSWMLLRRLGERARSSKAWAISFSLGHYSHFSTS